MESFEFLVEGPAVSLKAKKTNARRYQKWIRTVRAAAKKEWPINKKPTNSRSVTVNIVNYYTLAPPDVDNIIKPILDALETVVFIDDQQVYKVASENSISRAQLLFRTLVRYLRQGLRNIGNCCTLLLRGIPRIDFMTTSNGSVEASHLRDIAEGYKQRGYKVTVAPAANRLPKFLSRFTPDIVAKGPNESVVVEVKSPGRLRGIEYWKQLSSAVRQHPGWRLELVVSQVGDGQPPETINRKQIEARLEEGERLAEKGMREAALLITWAAAEAAMRLASKNYEIDLPDLHPATVVSRLYSDGLLERKEYVFLLDSMRVRNAVAHGFHEGRVKRSMLNRIQRLTQRRLL